MTDKNHVRSVVSGNPLKGLPLKTKIEFRLVDFNGSNSTARPDFVKNWEFFKGAVLGIFLKSKTALEFVGTAIIIAPGLAISATHNFSDVIEEMREGNVIPYGYGIRKGSADIWRVAEISFSERDDIIFLGIEAESELPPDNTYHQVGITTRAPKNGEKLHIVGFRYDSTDEKRAGYEMHGNLYTSSGVVTAVYPNGRGSLIP